MWISYRETSTRLCLETSVLRMASCSCIDPQQANATVAHTQRSLGTGDIYLCRRKTIAKSAVIMSEKKPACTTAHKANIIRLSHSIPTLMLADMLFLAPSANYEMLLYLSVRRCARTCVRVSIRFCRHHVSPCPIQLLSGSGNRCDVNSFFFSSLLFIIVDADVGILFLSVYVLVFIYCFCLDSVDVVNAACFGGAESFLLACHAISRSRSASFCWLVCMQQRCQATFSQIYLCAQRGHWR